MITLKEYMFGKDVSIIKDFIDTDPYSAAMKSEIAIYKYSPTDHNYIILIASRRLIKFIESLDGWSELNKNNQVRPALKKNAFPLVYGSEDLKSFMAI
jgi:hypothetical protein